MSDRPDPLTFAGFVVPVQCCLCNAALTVEQSKRLLLRLNYETTVVHLDCKMANKDKSFEDDVLEKASERIVAVVAAKELNTRISATLTKGASAADLITEALNKNQSHVDFGKELGDKFGTARVESFEEKELKKAKKQAVDRIVNPPFVMEEDTAQQLIQDAINKEIGPDSPRYHPDHKDGCGCDDCATDDFFGRTRTFESGATRDTDEGKLDYEAFLSPAVLVRYAQHLHKHRIQSDGVARSGDNWQLGIDKAAYMKSLKRHEMDVWLHHRGRSDLAEEDLETALCGVMFNSMGYLFEILKEKK